MTYFITIVLKLIPLYINILLGFLAGRCLNVQKETISKIIFYIISPLVIFSSVMRTELTTSILSLPLLTFGIASLIAILFHYISKRIWNDTTVNITAFSAGTGNTGYFGLPLAIFLLNEQGEGIYILGLFGFIIFETTTGFFFIASGRHSKKEMFQRLIRLPQLYAFFSGILLNLWGLTIPPIFDEYIISIKGSYAILGMMVIGMSIAKMSDFRLDKPFIGVTFLAKFVVWPAFAMIVILIDHYLFNFYNSIEHQAIIILSIVPLAVNLVVLSQILDVQPVKSASAVMLSTIFALFYVPIMCYFFIG